MLFERFFGYIYILYVWVALGHRTNTWWWALTGKQCRNCVFFMATPKLGGHSWTWFHYFNATQWCAYCAFSDKSSRWIHIWHRELSQRTVRENIFPCSGCVVLVSYSSRANTEISNEKYILIRVMVFDKRPVFFQTD